MKYLIFSQTVCNFLSPAPIAQLLDNAIIYLEQGHEVYFVWCNDSRSHYCATNTDCSRGACRICKRYMKTLFGSRIVRSHKNLQLIPYQDDGKPFPGPFNYESLEDIKNIKYKGVDVGLAAYSTYLSLSRNLNPLINGTFRSYFDKLIGLTCKYTDFLLNLIEKISPDMICTLNSRGVCSRPIWDITHQNHIPYLCWEGVYNRQSQYCKITFGNSTPHDPVTNKRIVEEKWANSALPEDEKIEIGEDFFLKRRNSIPAGDKLFVKSQVQGMLPDGFDRNKHNILILNGSEDEYAALFADYQSGVAFKSQYPGIKYLAEAFSKEHDYHLYLKIHPNLKDVSYLYHTKLYELEKAHPNFTVIPPDSPVSTYACIDACEKAVVFGSTTGPEATYWGKPVLLLSNCPYSLLDVCYVPPTPEEAIALLKTPDLPAKDKLQAIKFGYFALNDENEEYVYFHPFRLHKDMLGRSFDYHTIDVGTLRSKALILLQIAGKYFYYKHLNYPQEEDPSLYQ